MTHLWAYAYQIAPSLASRHLGTIRSLLKEGTVAARGGAHRWSARLVLDRGATYILIVSDSPGRDHPMDRRLEGELRRLEAPFSVTEPLAVTDPGAALTTLTTSGGNGRGTSSFDAGRH